MRISDWSSDVCSSDLDIGGNAAPQKLDNLPRAIIGVHAGTAELQHLARPGGQNADIVFPGAVEPAAPPGGLAADQPVVPAPGVRAAAALLLDHPEVIGDRRLLLEVPPEPGPLPGRTGAHPTSEHPP